MPELDLHGLTQYEALPLVDDFLHRMSDSGLHEVTIVHGKGTGVLRNAVRRYVSKHKLVKSYWQGDEWQGGEGVTIVELTTK